MGPFVERDCTFHHDGHSYTMGGAVVTDQRITGYCSSDMKRLTTWHGEDLGRLRIVSCWPIPNGIMSQEMYQVEAVVKGIVYTGRTMGGGMIARLRRKANQ